MSVLRSLLLGGQAYATVERLLAGLTFEAATTRVPGLPHSIYDLVWHIEVCQDVLLRVIAEEGGEGPPAEATWPAGPPEPDDWEDLLSRLRAGLYEASEFSQDPASLSERDREVLEDLAAHGAYHWGQVALMRRLLGGWPEPADA